MLGNAEHLPNITMVVASVLACVQWRKFSNPLSHAGLLDASLTHVVLPADVVTKFVQAASPWKAFQGIEFQGLLLGKVDSDGVVHIFELWIPPQEASQHHCKEVDDTSLA